MSRVVASDHVPTFPDLAGKTAVVTGGSKGIGAASCRALAANGVKIAVVARGSEAVDELVVELKGAGACCPGAPHKGAPGGGRGGPRPPPPPYRERGRALRRPRQLRRAGDNADRAGEAPDGRRAARRDRSDVATRAPRRPRGHRLRR